MPDKTRWGLENENFNFYFHKLTALMTEAQREALPRDLYFKLFKRGGAYDTTSSNKLTFLAKLFILIKALRKRVIIMVEDDNEGMDEEEYFQYKALLSKRKIPTEVISNLVEDAVFVLGNKELFSTYSALNQASCGPAYNYMIKAKNEASSKVEGFCEAQDFVPKFITNYESNRKRIHMNSGLNMSEWLVLIALYHGREIQSSVLYNDIYKHSFNSSKTKIKVAYGTLEMRGYIEKIGQWKWMKIRITPLGRDKITEIITKRLISI
jgi:DNA-binding MarR family transcriptional regulator